MSSKMKKFLAVILTLVVILVVVLAALPLFLDPEKANLSPEIRSQVLGSFVELPEGFVHCELAGREAGHVAVLIHGFSVPHYVWNPTFEALANNGFRVLRYDLFDRGYSDRPKATYDRAFFERQLLNILEALEISRPVDVVGLSMGGLSPLASPRVILSGCANWY